MLTSKQKRNLFISLSFILMAIFSAWLIGMHGQLYITNDSLFHSSRLLELIKSHQLFPRYAFNSFNFDGSAVMSMYPDLFFYSIVIIYELVKSIKTALLISFILGTLVSLMINYWSSRSYTRDWLSSYLFAIIYAMSGEATAMYFYSPFSDLGVYLSYLFLPLVIFGFLAFLKQSRWVMLSLGMSAIMYSNVISVAFIAGLLFFWLLCDCRHVTLIKCKNLLKAVLLMMLSTVAQWIPMLRLMRRNQLRIPTANTIVPVSLTDLLFHALRNNFTVSCQYLTFFSLLGLAVGLLCFRRLSHFTKQLYLFAAFIILLSSKLFPWGLFSQNNILFKWVRSIQVTIRMMVIPQLILEFILATVIADYVKRHPILIKWITVTSVILVLGLAQFKIQSEIISQSDGVSHFSQIKRPVIRSHIMDYWPWASVNNRQRPLIYYSKAVDDDNGRTIGTYHLGYGDYHFNTRTMIHRLSLPVFYYYGTPYRVRLDGRRIKPYPAHRQIMTLSHVKPGKHLVHIEIPLTISDIIARSLSLLSLPIYGWLLIDWFRRKHES